jgi:lipase chaperone LimK
VATIFSDKFTWLCVALATGIAFAALAPVELPAPALVRIDANDGWRAPIGPGTLSVANPLAGIGGGAPTGRLSPSIVGPDGQLLINLELKQLFDDFLLRGQAGAMTARIERLRASLDATLPPAARAQALALVPSYVDYLTAHDALLARQQLKLAPGAALDAGYVERLANWQSQRARLRQSTLPAAATQAWFTDDDAQLSDAIDALRARARPDAGIDDGSEADSNTLRARRLHDVSQDQALDARISERLAQATQPLDRPDNTH